MTTIEHPNLTVSYLGPQASFSHQAALQLFPPTNTSSKNIKLAAYPSITSLFTAITSDSVHLSIVPLENSTNGPVAQTLSLLSAASDAQDGLEVCGETAVKVRHCLAGRRRNWAATAKEEPQEQDDFSHITSLHTHPQAWSQCTPFLERYFGRSSVVRHDEDSTSGAAQIVASDGSGSSAAICSRLAAEVFGLDVLMDDVHSDTTNCTRFLVLRKRDNDVQVPSLVGSASGNGRYYALMTCLLTGLSSKEKVESSMAAMQLCKTKTYTVMSDGREWIFLFIEAEHEFYDSIQKLKVSLAASTLTTWDWGVWRAILPP